MPHVYEGILLCALDGKKKIWHKPLNFRNMERHVSIYFIMTTNVNSKKDLST